MSNALEEFHPESIHELPKESRIELRLGLLMELPVAKRVELLEDRGLEGLSPEQLLRAVPIEKRLEGLSPEQIFRAVSIEKLLEDLPPEQLLRAVPIEKRLEGLSPDQRVQGLSAEELFELAKKLKGNGASGETIEHPPK